MVSLDAAEIDDMFFAAVTDDIFVSKLVCNAGLIFNGGLKIKKLCVCLSFV